MIPEKLVLVVEDNPDDEMLTLRALRKANVGATVHVERDGAAALAYLEGADPLPCLVLLDLKLPRVNGLEVLRRVRRQSRYAALPIVLLSSSDEPSDVSTAYDLGANSYVLKPVDYERFETALSAVGHYWLESNVSTSAACEPVLAGR